MQKWHFLSHPLTRITGLAAFALAAVAMFASASVSTGNAQAPSCSNTTLTWPAESGGTLAFADAGAGNVISFICIESTEFPGGEAGPFTSDGWVADGCFIIDGIGTDVVAVFRELPDVKPGCDQLISISAGIEGDLEPTPSPLTPTPTTAPPTATSPASTATAVATATATRTATTPPVATATRTATTPPMATSTMAPGSTATMVPPTSVATSPASATSTPVRPTVLPPNTGGGTSGGSGGSATLFASIAIMMVAAGAGALFVSRKTERNRS